MFVTVDVKAPETSTTTPPKKVALIACVRKVLTILNVMMKTGMHWDSELAQLT